MKILSTLLLLVMAHGVTAQKGLDEMIAAEKRFAAYSVTNGTREAFLQFADTGSVMFSNAVPVNGYQLWRARKPSPGLLNWRPSHAEISASGDFGWTCGPWTFQPKSISDSVVANGHFFTVWQKKSGAWKFILDVGYDGGGTPLDTAVKKMTIEKSSASLQTMVAAEKAFISDHDSSLVTAQTRWASDAIVLTDDRNGVKSKFTIESPKAVPCPVTFTVQGNGISPAGDLGYVYGLVCFGGKKETYLRIWRHERNGWKIALEMLGL